MSTIAGLVEALPPGVVVTEPASLDAYRWDRANDPRAVAPLAVVRAECTEHVQAAVRFAAAAGVPVVPRGAGTGLSGGVSADRPCVVVSLERMRGIDIDPVTRMAT
ncbi:MAG: FAD-binding oxidoreductase, partial [Leucobacter sp.]